ncbi:hypothetical protein B0H11DRAFT_2293679 [Mycena galericulata]|nr:hypothetical protein B0H11DRAFT_2293679 [Mycena galericulata]
MAIFITARCVLDTVRCVTALEGEKKTETNGVPPNTNSDTASNAFWFSLAAVADASIIFRTFIVWKRNWFVIIVPSLLYLAGFGITVWLLSSIKGFDPERESLFQTLINKIGIVVIALSLAINLMCTGLISFRLFSEYRKIAALSSSVAGNSSNMKIISILVESATLYTLFLIGILIAEGLNSYVNYILIDCTSPITGLVFSYIILRVSRGTSYGDEPGSTAQNPPSALHFRLQQATHQRSDLVLEDDIQAGEDKRTEYANAPPV